MASSIPITGYLYTAYGDAYVQAAVAAVSSLRKHDPTAHVTLVTDRHVHEDPATLTSSVRGQEGSGTLRYHNVVKAAFDRVVVKEARGGFAGKVDFLSNEYYGFTCYLDTDTYVCADPRPIFDLLEHFDICLVPDPAEVDIVQPGLTPYNTGVMFFGPGTDKLFTTYKAYYNDELTLMEHLKGHPARNDKTDQPSFMMAIRDTEVRVHALPNVWNARYGFNQGLMGEVKIIHGTATDYKLIQTAMNTTIGNRVWEAKR